MRIFEGSVSLPLILWFLLCGLAYLYFGPPLPYGERLSVYRSTARGLPGSGGGPVSPSPTRRPVGRP